MMVSFLHLLGFAASAFACESCYGPQDDIVRTREVYPIRPNQNLVKRMQPDAQAAAYGPTHACVTNVMPTTRIDDALAILPMQ